MVEVTIIVFMLWVNCLLIAAGIASKAMTSMIPIPTTLIRITTLKTTGHKRILQKKSPYPADTISCSLLANRSGYTMSLVQQGIQTARNKNMKITII